MGSVLVITPTYNERENLPALCELLRASVPDAHVLVVDDASPDGTGELADDMHRQHPERVSVLHRAAKLGLGSAYLAGFRKAIADGWETVVQIDADLSHDPGSVPALLDALAAGADVAIGSRYVRGGAIEGWGAGRHALSRGGSIYSRSILASPVKDMTAGFKAIRRTVLEAIDLCSVRSEGYAFQIELTYRALRKGFTVVEVPIVFVDRRAGRSKLSGRIFAEAIGIPWKLRLDALRKRL